MSNRRPSSDLKRRPHPVLRFLGTLFYILVLTGALAFGTMLGWVGQSEVLSDGNPFSALLPPKSPQAAFNSRNDLTILVLGCDVDYERNHGISNTQARSDMIMVARFDFEDKTIGAVSIPRDVQVDLPGYKRQKINGFHAIGGPDLSKKAVEYVLPEVQIDRVIVLDFEAFQEMVDLVGGVEVYVSKRMKYDDNWGNLHIDLEKGRQHLDGYQAMGYVRWRKNNPGIGGGDSDIERQKRHHEFLLAMKSQMMSNWQKAPKMIDKTKALSGNAFTNDEMKSLLFWAKGLNSDNIMMGGVPVVDVPETSNLAIIQREVEQRLIDLWVIEPRYSFEEAGRD